MTDIAVIALSLGLEKNHMMQDYQSNRPVRQQPPGRFPNESDRTVERIRKRKKKQTQRRMVLCGAIAALAVIIVGIILLAKGCSGGTDALAGTWEFDGTTTYSFDGSGSGAMELPSISYDFTYTIDGNKLMIDYVNESVRDSEYEFTVDGNTLTLIGGEGTVGGTYELKRSSKKSEELIEKLSQMTSIHQAAELKSNLYVSERVKPLNEQIYYLVDNINTAINRGKQISFRYFHYDQHRKEVPNNDGKRYFFSPYCLVWNEDHYYAIGYSEKHRKLGTFRVDRMKEVEILSVDAAAKPADFNLPEFTRRVFDMYDGETKKVTLVCKNDLMNYIVDRFGDEVDTVPGDCGHFRAVAEVSVSQTFFAWVFQFNGDIRITAPEEVVLQYGEMLKNALQT